MAILSFVFLLEAFWEISSLVETLLRVDPVKLNLKKLVAVSCLEFEFLYIYYDKKKRRKKKEVCLS